MNERMLTIVFIGAAAVIAAVGSVVLFYGGKEVAGTAVLGLVTTALSLLAPSPLSKNFVPPDPVLDDGGHVVITHGAAFAIALLVVLIALKVFGLI